MPSEFAERTTSHSEASSLLIHRFTILGIDPWSQGSHREAKLRGTVNEHFITGRVIDAGPWSRIHPAWRALDHGSEIDVEMWVERIGRSPVELDSPSLAFSALSGTEGTVFRIAGTVLRVLNPSTVLLSTVLDAPVVVSFQHPDTHAQPHECHEGQTIEFAGTVEIRLIDQMPPLGEAQAN